ncbi:cytochrome-c oxidase, cbb3-type subunit III [Marinagarivorans algicola]|uniref:cytochrome-c oxidase, cbb3-type subunit III n=1 Tax=Marinagarivorans algicola TaxID=1513270 RepID=UPI000B16F4A2|nr:cytochrome-c oxidase, cbb3-type subunit III [Marinagarivorans algicola]
MSTFWSLWVIVLTLTCIGLCTWILFANRKVAKRDDEDPANQTTGHVYDGIEEYDNPLPKWWFQLFIGTIIFTAIYLVLYPGLGTFKGVLGWTSVNQLESRQEKAQEQYKDSYEKYNQMSVEELSQNAEAMKMGVRLFANNCAVCHGADGGGNYGFPNLTDNDWLHGGSVDKIRESIVKGRNANMPAWGPTIGEEGVAAVTEYVLSLSDLDHDATQLAKGKEVFGAVCSACHGADAKGQIVMGAPNLTDDIWLYDSERDTIANTVRNGRVNRMPAQEDLLREDKIHLLTAYVYSLSH